MYLKGFTQLKASAEGSRPDGRLDYGKVSFTDFPLLDELQENDLLVEPDFTAASVAQWLGESRRN